MPLSKAKNRQRMKESRATCVQPNLVEPVQPKLNALRELVKNIEAGGHALVQPNVQPNYTPWYNPRVHKQGDRVRMRDRTGQVQIVTVPELDADGNPMPTL